MPEADGAVGWRDKRIQPPKEKDCDPQGCILVWHAHNGAMVMNLRVFEEYGTFCTHWMRLPPPPIWEG